MDIAELVREYRATWVAYDPGRIDSYLMRVEEDQRLELLALLLQVETEFAYQPPEQPVSDETTVSVEEDERIRPNLQLFVLRYPEIAEQQEYIIRLSVLEYALRLRHDPIPPNPDSYLPLCHRSPERLLKLLRTTEHRIPIPRNNEVSEPVGASDSTVKETKASISISMDPLPYYLGCFFLVRLVGKGGMGYVHAAIDLRSTAQVALKVMRRTDPWSVYRFIEEFSWLSQLNHPNLVKLYDAFSEGDVRYFSMELVEGRTIRQWFNRIDKHQENRWHLLRRVLAQAASAIHFLHSQGVIHCDIKCSNLMITSRRRAVLLDLGLAVREGNNQPLVGTLQYMAPEVINGGYPTKASDWYSFGMMLYEVLTDKYPPIHVDVAGESDEKRYRLDQQTLEQELEMCPPELAELCKSLLVADISERPSGADIVHCLGGDSASLIVPGGANQSYARRDTLDQLQALDAATVQFGRKLVVVRGHSGIGKSTVVRQWMEERDGSPDLCLSVRCYRQDHTPLRLLNLIVQELVQVLKNLPEDLWMNALSLRVEEVGAAFPQIFQLSEPEFPTQPRPKPASPSYLVKSKGLQHLAKWLIELSQTKRLVIVIDDAQWADRDSVILLSDLLRSPEFHGLVVAVNEGDATILDQTLQEELGSLDAVTLEQLWENILLEGLPEEACHSLLRAWSQRSNLPLTPTISDNIVHRSEGNPFLLQELFRAYSHYAKRDGISDEQWLNTDSQKNVRRRFSLLPIQSENVLQYLAVAGQSISFHQLQMVSRILPHELQRTLNLLASQGWIRSRSENVESDVEIAHENFRRVVLRSLPKERLHRRHFRMARMLSSEVPPPWSRMANHYWMAERFREAATCYLEAARAAFRSADFVHALECLERAEHPGADRSPSEQQNVLRLKADCLAGHGSSTAAAQIYESLANQSVEEESRDILLCLAGEQWIRAGQLDLGLERLRTVLSQSGLPTVGLSTWSNWRQSRIAQLWLQLQTLRTAMEDAPAKITYQATTGSFSELDQCLNRISIPMTFLDNQLGPELILRMMNRCRVVGSELDQSQAILNGATLLSFAGRRWRQTALGWHRVGRRLARNSGSPAARGTAQMNSFIWNVQRGRFDKAISAGQAALDWFVREPRALQWEIQFLHWGLLGCHWHRGELKQLSESTDQLRQSAVDRNDSMSQYWMNVAAPHWADLAFDETERGRQSLDIAESAIANHSFQSPRFFLWLSRAAQYLYEGQSTKACTLLDSDWKRLDKAYVLSNGHYRWLALSMRLCGYMHQLRDNKAGATGLQISKVQSAARRACDQLQSIQEPIFRTYGQAFHLALATLLGRNPTIDRWQSCINQLRSGGHFLMANALQWHFGIHHQDDDLLIQARAAFADEGCPRPDRLLEVILPLPSL